MCVISTLGAFTALGSCASSSAPCEPRGGVTLFGGVAILVKERGDNAAQKAGFKTIFVKRSMEWGAGTEVSVDGEYDLVISNFNELNSIKD